MIRPLHGDIRFDWRPAGLVCEIILPLSPDQADDPQLDEPH
jgi:hypothetical protein